MCKGRASRQIARSIASRAFMKKKGRLFLSKLNVLGKLHKRSSSWKNSRAGSGCSGCEVRCCSGKVLLQNYKNFAKSSVPERLMYFCNGVWNDYPHNVADIMKKAFARGLPTMEVKFDGMIYLVDFLRMLQVDLKVGIQRSVAWIDKNGKCFFPKLIIEEDKEETSVENGSNDCESDDVNMIAGPELPSSPDLISEASKTDRFGPSSFNRFSSDGEVTMDAWDLQQKVVLQKALCTKVEGMEIPGCSKEPSARHQLPLTDQTCKTMLDMDLVHKLEVPATGLSDSSCKFSVRTTGSQTFSRNLGSFGATSQEYTVDVSLRLGIGSMTTVPKDVILESLGDKLIKLEEHNPEYKAVGRSFVSGLCKFASGTKISGIYKNPHTSVMSQARLQAFDAQVQILNSSRGNANVKRAWYGASRKSVSTIILHGFGMSGANSVNSHGPYGHGVHLSPEECSYISAAFSDVEENGEQYVVLCRVILGNVEEIPFLSSQFHPTSDKYDSGVDDLLNPKRYIVWSTHMNTHIIPEYILRFKVPQHVHEFWARVRLTQSICCAPEGVSNNNKDDSEFKFQRPPAPASSESTCKQQTPGRESNPIRYSTLMSFTKLFSVIRKKLPDAYMNALERLYADFKGGKIGKDVLIKKVRLIAGDKLLITAIQSIQRETITTNMENGVECRLPRSLGMNRNSSKEKGIQGKIVNSGSIADSFTHSLFPSWNSRESSSCSQKEQSNQLDPTEGK